MDETKTCPFCAEEIKAAAIICKHCNSSLASSKKNLEQSNSSADKVGCLFAVLIVLAISTWLMVTCSKNEPKAEQSTTASPAIETTEEPAKQISPSFNLTAEQFKDNFNKSSRKLSSGLILKHYSTKTEADSITQIFGINKNLAVSLSIDKKINKVQTVMFCGSGDGTLRSGANILLVMGLLIEIVDPELSPEERGDILKDLMQGDVLNGECTRNNINYQAKQTNDAILLFISKPEE